MSDHQTELEDFEIRGDLTTAYVTGTQIGDAVELQVGRGVRSLRSHEMRALGAWLLAAANRLLPPASEVRDA